jgi:uncharacterized protein YkwD
LLGLRLETLSLVFVTVVSVALAETTVVFTDNLLEKVPGEEEVETRVFELVNERRAENGVDLLAWDDRLAAAARHHLVEMAVLGYFTHESPTPGFEDVTDRVYLTGLTDRTIGENLVVTNAYEKAEDVPVIFIELWDESLEHRNEFLNGAYNYTGVGVYKNGDNYYCAQIFSQRRIEFDVLTLTDDGAGRYVLSGEGRLVGDGRVLRLADAGNLTEVRVKKDRFSFECPLEKDSGVHDIYFFAAVSSSHGLMVDTDRPIEDAFMKDALVVDFSNPE